jgi:hypothetical protein
MPRGGRLGGREEEGGWTFGARGREEIECNEDGDESEGWPAKRRAVERGTTREEESRKRVADGIIAALTKVNRVGLYNVE